MDDFEAKLAETKENIESKKKAALESIDRNYKMAMAGIDIKELNEEMDNYVYEMARGRSIINSVNQSDVKVREVKKASLLDDSEKNKLIIQTIFAIVAVSLATHMAHPKLFSSLAQKLNSDKEVIGTEEVIDYNNEIEESYNLGGRK